MLPNGRGKKFSGFKSPHRNCSFYTSSDSCKDKACLTSGICTFVRVVVCTKMTSIFFLTSKNIWNGEMQKTYFGIWGTCISEMDSVGKVTLCVALSRLPWPTVVLQAVWNRGRIPVCHPSQTAHHLKALEPFLGLLRNWNRMKIWRHVIFSSDNSCYTFYTRPTSWKVDSHSIHQGVTHRYLTRCCWASVYISSNAGTQKSALC